ncbi:MAG: hypothetical protein GC152_09245 [Alphaproteobacteria bacterium]|nr:hypothetical protein [Alphaproteobacteria bacterium]
MKTQGAISALLAVVMAAAAPLSAAPAFAADEVALAAMMDADRAFAARAGEIGAAAAFVEFAAPDVRAFPGGAVPLKGKGALAEWTAGWSPATEISWAPEEGFISDDGTFGYTWGFSEFRTRTDDGAEDVTFGKYVTVWRKQPDGAWKWVADLGNAAPPPDQRQPD